MLNVAPSRVYGVDFTCAPRRNKPITVAAGLVAARQVSITAIAFLSDFLAFESFLQTPGPWVAALDFPFGLPVRLLDALGWGRTWAQIVETGEAVGMAAFESALKTFRAAQPPGAKEPRRAADLAAGSVSAMKMFNPPVGRMYFRGAVRLLRAGVNIRPCHATVDPRTVVEAYPALVARAFIGRMSYKADDKRRQTAERRAARAALIDHIRGPGLYNSPYRLRLNLPDPIAQRCLDDASGDTLDSVLAAIQAAWLVENSGDEGAPAAPDTREGWIYDPTLKPPGSVILAPEKLGSTDTV
jgi:hypothetical protein